MTPDRLAELQVQLAEQQLMAAWVQGGAAVVQAIAAALAIWFSIKIARDAAAREMAAEAASVARAEAAERAASARVARVENAEINDPIDFVLRSAEPVFANLRPRIADAWAKANDRSVVAGDHSSPELLQFEEILEGVAARVSDPELGVAITHLRTIVKPRRRGLGAVPWAAYAQELSEFQSELDEALQRLVRLGRT